MRRLGHARLYLRRTCIIVVVMAHAERGGALRGGGAAHGGHEGD